MARTRLARLLPRQAREQRRDVLHLQEVDRPGQHARTSRLRAHRQQVGDRIDDHDRRAQLPRRRGASSARCVSRPKRDGRSAWNWSRPFVDPRREIDPARPHVAQHLLRRLLEEEVQAALAAAAGGIDKVSCERRLAGTGRAGEQDGAAAIVASGHRASRRARAARSRRAPRTPDARSVSDVTGSTPRPPSSMRNGYSFVPCVRAAVLHDPEAAGRDLLLHAVIELDHGSPSRTPRARGGSACSSPFSPVITAVRLRSRSQRNSRRSSARRIASSSKPPKATRACRGRRVWRRSN